MLVLFNSAAIAAVVIGVAFRLDAVMSNKSFQLVPETPQIICYGSTYRIVRHPAYLGTLLIVAGLAYLFGGLLESVLFSYLFFVILSDRARLEEKLIIEKFPYYAEYQKDVGFLFPKFNFYGR